MRSQDKIVDRLGYWDEVQDYFKLRYRGWNPDLPQPLSHDAE